jgi:hypothetical protein
MSFGFKFVTGSNTNNVTIISDDLTPGYVVASQLVPYQNSYTTINFSGTNFSDYFVTYYLNSIVTTTPAALSCTPDLILDKVNKTLQVRYYFLASAGTSGNIVVNVIGI